MQALCLMGPTAIGKTALAMALTDVLPCDIISVDSGMVYRGLDIGTAKPTSEQLQLYPHQLIDICDPDTAYSAGEFLRDVELAIAKSHANKRIPLLVGGTMLYFKVLQHGIAQLPPAHPEIRKRLTSIALVVGWPALHARLRQVDPGAATRIAKHDAQRIQRALEVYELTGKPLSAFPTYKVANLSTIDIVLLPETREDLKKRIALRLQNMLSQGLVAELAALQERYQLSAELPAMRTVGYRQVWQYLAGTLKYDEMVTQMGIATNQLVKRQLTWLRNWQGTRIVSNGNEQEILTKILAIAQAAFS